MKTAVGNHISEHLAGAVRELLESLRGYSGANRDGNRIVRLEVKLPAVDPLAWLAARSGDGLFYWRDRKGHSEHAAFGCADELALEPTDSPHILTRELHSRFGHEAAMGRYYGGMCFDPKRPLSNDWRPFGTLRLLLPQWELIRTGDESTLACHVAEGNLDDVYEQSSTLAEMADLERMQANLAISKLQHTPEYEAWQQELKRILPTLSGGKVEKLVLDRQSSLVIDQPIQPGGVLARLRETMTNSYLFGLSPRPGYWFLGASPERLYARQGTTIASEAVAGTRQRGRTDVEDTERETELLSCDKEKREHGFVARHVADSLHTLCDEVTTDQTPQVVRLPRLMHRIERFRGRLKSGVDDADILATLHPTPAVAGYPVDKAIGELRQLSPVERGWYAGPVGWVAAQAAEFAVGIRSALITPDRVMFYVGAGIVDGSTAEAEWQELDAKLRSLLGAFTA